MKKVKIQMIWKDRKRHLGLPLSFTRYALSEDRLFMSSGFVNIQDEEVLLYRVSDIALKRGLLQRLVGVGTVTVMSSDKSMPKLELVNVKDPVGVKELIHKTVENMKIQRGVRMSEITSTGGDDHDCCHDHGHAPYPGDFEDNTNND